MTKTENKVTFGLKNVHIAPIESINSETQIITYGKIFRFPGAMNLELEPKGESKAIPADDVDYHFMNSNEGYEGKLKVPHDSVVKRSITSADKKEVYDAWFTSVYEPTSLG